MVVIRVVLPPDAHSDQAVEAAEFMHVPSGGLIRWPDLCSQVGASHQNRVGATRVRDAVPGLTIFGPAVTRASEAGFSPAAAGPT